MSLISQSVDKFERAVREIRSDTARTINKINVLADKCFDSDARQRRNNLLFYGSSGIVNKTV